MVGTSSVGHIGAIQVDRSHPERTLRELGVDVVWLVPVRATERRAARGEMVGAIPINLPYGEESVGVIPINLPYPRPERDGEEVVGAIPINLPYPRPDGDEEIVGAIPIHLP